MPDCASCGRPLDADDHFCRHCGTVVPDRSGPDEGEHAAGVTGDETTLERSPLGEAPTRRFCTACGAALQSHMEFCPSCGTRQGTGAAAEPAPNVAAQGPATDTSSAGAAQPAASAQLAPRTGGGNGRRTAVIVAVVVVVLATIGAAVYFGFFYGKGGEEQAAEQVDPIMSSLVPKQKQLEKALQSLAVDSESIATLVSAAQTLGSALEEAIAKTDGIVVDGPEAEEIVTAFQAALDAHYELTEAIGDLPTDPAAITTTDVDALIADAEAAMSAYGDLATLAPDITTMPFPTAAADQLAAVSDQIERLIGENSTLLGFLDNLEALFPDSQAERLTAEDVVAQLESTELPPDNAAGQMAAQAVRLRSVVSEIDGLTPPDDRRARQVQATYRSAVMHWVTAARQYAKWMRNLQDYYQVSGDWPPANGIEADTYLDPAYDAARQAQDLATEARQTLATQIDQLAGTVGGTTGFTADDM